jgi:hypothetical protein
MNISIKLKKKKINKIIFNSKYYIFFNKFYFYYYFKNSEILNNDILCMNFDHIIYSLLNVENFQNISIKKMNLLIDKYKDVFHINIIKHINDIRLIFNNIKFFQNEILKIFNNNEKIEIKANKISIIIDSFSEFSLRKYFKEYCLQLFIQYIIKNNLVCNFNYNNILYSFILSKKTKDFLYIFFLTFFH